MHIQRYLTRTIHGQSTRRRDVPTGKNDKCIAQYGIDEESQMMSNLVRHFRQYLLIAKMAHNLTVAFPLIVIISLLFTDQLY